MEYTLEEQSELSVCPISTAYVDFTEAQLTVRLQIAKKIHARFMEMDSTMPSWAQEAYTQCPMWGFYTHVTHPGSSCMRVYGAMEDDGMHVESAHIWFTNDVIGGVPRDNLVRVDRWSASQKECLRLNNAPGWFLDPIAFIRWIAEHYA